LPKRYYYGILTVGKRYDMSIAKKIAISLPAELVAELERIMKETGETRSAVIRRTIEFALKREAMDSEAMRYISGYLKYPETDEEKNIVRATALKSLGEEPWE
jgi:metal-responsive CopG/Arc/MetJ family transcriptional regulator